MWVYKIIYRKIKKTILRVIEKDIWSQNIKVQEIINDFFINN